MTEPQQNKDRDDRGYYLSGHQLGGNPFLYDDPDEVDKLLEAYYEECKELKGTITYAGVARALGTTRKTLRDMVLRDNRLSEPIKRAVARCEEAYESIMIDRSGGQVAGVIFAAKNWGWVDKQEIDIRAQVTELTDAELQLKLVESLKALSVQEQETLRLELGEPALERTG